MAHVAFGLLALAAVTWLTWQGVTRPDQTTRLQHDVPVLVMYLVGAWVIVPSGY
jgi:hypothetical protein